MRGSDSARHAESDEDAALEALRTALGRPPLALVAEIASWPAPGTAPAPEDAEGDAGRAPARTDAVTPVRRTPH
ncbi:hypothetical protein [Streptomyces sp. NPDC050392]|uniref:hypothetical protein n=1 Tax=Streptomyces sp. NPDC050392 TaxID=3155782 RepID=UPI00343B5294